MTDSLIERMTEIAHRDSAVSVTVRADDLRALLSKLRAPVADERVSDDTLWSWAEQIMGGKEAHHVGRDRVLRFARAALASAPADPQAAEVDFLVRVLENLDTWRAEEWSELLERRPAILAMLRPMVLASAPVAGEAQPVAWLHQCRKKPELTQVTMKKHEPSLAAKGFRPVPLYAAPQASEADPLQGAADWLMRAFEPPLSASDLARQLVIGYNRATRLRDAALSAQPGAQKNCNCATCRPYSVEMRMILCEVCGDKRCPHAADHRNECTSHPKQHNDGGAHV
ncbi:hypothetical protein [Achromobacter mucicolens]|uniref:hypothetical protein n=1 Tax=Achromobacter mucicolens TaxID=1389922 RepID=UPI0028AF5E42|nr:hypothetical protein [Achromobacter mucicolens]